MPIVFNPIDPTTSDLEAVVSSLLSNGIELVAGSVYYQGASGQGSTFTGGEGIGFGSGLLLTSGNGSPAASNTSNGSSTGTGSGPDSDLSNAGGYTTYDANTITFSVIATDPTVTSITFNFAFGSEEYPEFVNSFPDIGGIFVNGVNVAFFSNGQPLTVNTANLSVGSFIDNASSIVPIEYDGISLPLTVTVDLAPGVNVIKLGAADLNDSALDSGLFIASVRGSDDDGTGGVINVSPVAADDSATTTSGKPVKIDVDANDYDPDGSIVSLDLDALPGHGSVVINPDGTITYTPEAGFVGVDTFKYEVTDNDGGVDLATVTVTVNPGTTPPPSNVFTPNADVANFLNSAAGIDIAALGGNDSVFGSKFDDIMNGGGGDDFLRGKDGDDILRGSKGNDTLKGDGGNDVLNGGEGSDNLFGDLGNDTLLGGLDDDRLFGGMGDDLLSGGDGADRFYFEAADGAGGHDQILDFQDGVDLIVLRGTTVTSMSTVSNGTLLTLDNGSDVLLRGIALGSVTAADFVFQGGGTLAA